MKPLVSILIPAYNAGDLVAQTIESAIGQTWEPKEIIVVDDGSTDKTLAVARHFASSKVQVLSQQNQGAAAARNRALREAQGDYVQWLDADDLLSANKIARQMEVAGCQDNRTLLSSEWGEFAYRIERAKFTRTSLWRDLTPVEWLLRKMGENIHMQTATWLVSRKLTEAAGPWDARLLSDDDGEYFCRVLLASNGVRFVPEARVFYRIMPSTRLSYIGESDKKKDAMLLSMQMHVEYIRSLEDSVRVREACLRYLRNWSIYFCPERPDILKQLEDLGESLGGRLEAPELRWKYAWIKPLLGWSLAKRAQFTLPRIKASILKFWDRKVHDWKGVHRLHVV